MSADGPMEAWLMSDDIKDQRDENRRSPNVPVSFEQLSDLGVWAMHMDPAAMLEKGAAASRGDERSPLDQLADKMHFANRDEVCCSPDHLPEYDAKLKMFFTEHIHEDDEIRLIKAGSGFFDVRNQKDEWVRIWVKPGDLIVIPAGIYHRFTMDRANFTHAIRLFAEVPKWTPINRPCDEHPIRVQYMNAFFRPGGPQRDTICGPADNENNFYIHYPEKFDEVMKPLMRSVSATNGKDMIVLYITGDDQPHYEGGSWCPDCVHAKPILSKEVKRVRDLWAKDGRKVIFVQAGCSRMAYLRNPEYPYRTHPFIKLSAGVPTVMVLAGVEDEGFVRDRLDGNVPDTWKLADQ